MITKDSYLDNLNKALKNEQFYIVDSIFAEYVDLDNNKSIELLKFSLDSDLFKKGLILESHNFNNYWKQLDTHFISFSDEQKLLILDQIKNIKSWNIITETCIYKIAEKFSNDLDDVAKVNFYQDYLSKFLKGGILNPKIDLGIVDEDMNTFWLVNKLDSNSYFNEDTLIDLKFKFSKYTFALFLSTLKKIDKESKYISSNNISNHNKTKMLYSLIENSQLSYLKKETFPIEYYKIHIIQRIYIRIFINSKNTINENIIIKLIKSIDQKYIFYGQDMGEFLRANIRLVKKHHKNFSELLSVNFKDAFSFQEVNYVSESPFIYIDELDSLEKVKFIISNLKKIKEDNSYDFFNEKTLFAQNNEIVTKLSNETIWRKFKTNFDIFIKELIDNRTLRNKYKIAITSLLVYGLEKQIIDETLPIYYIAKLLYRGRLVNFDFHLEKLYESLIEMDKFVNFINKDFYSILFSKTKTESLQTKNYGLSIENNFIDLLGFINTDLGRYYYVIRKVPINLIKNEYYSDFILGINKVDKQYTSYLKGAFFHFFSEVDIPTESDPQMFIGYSHNYFIKVQQELCDFFRVQALTLFDSDIDDDIITRNISVVLSTTIDLNIQEIKLYKENHKLKIKILHKILELYLYYDEEFKTYVASWIKWYVKNFEFSMDVITGDVLIHHVDISSDKILNLINILSSISEVKNNKKVEEFTFLHIRYIEKYSKDQHNTLLSLISFLLNNNLIKINSYFIQGLNSVFKELYEKKFIELIDKYFDVLEDRLYPNDFEKFKIDYKFK